MFCASQASTATANDERSTTASVIDRHNPIIGRRSFTAPCFSGDDYVAPYIQLSKITRIPSSSGDDGRSIQVEKGRRSSSGNLSKLVNSDIARKSFGCGSRPASDVATTPRGSSSRYLLGSGYMGPGTVLTEGETSGSRRGFNAVEENKKSCGGSDKVVAVTDGEASDSKGGSGGVEEEKKTGGSEQVVVLKVSLHCHCRGCEGKVKKLLSRMQGVTSFNIDFASKKVTITGDITPLEVLGRLSKVKNAQFWTPSQSPLPRANPEN